MTAVHDTPKVYVASKSKYGPLWQEFREAWDGQATVISTWIDECGEGEPASLSDLWLRCIAEASSADLLIACHEAGDVWKGAYVEIGAALAAGRPVYIVGSPPGSFIEHPLVRTAKSAHQALDHFIGAR